MAKELKLEERHKYYLLGYIIADGCLCTSSKGYDFIQITTTDAPMAKKLSKILKTKVTRFKTKWKVRYTISIWNRAYVDWYKSQGICKRKTGKEIYPDVIPEYKNHFIRGFFDGDGMVIIFKKLLISGFACANREFLLRLRRDLSDYAGISKDAGTMRKENDAECYKLKYSISDTIRLCRFLYNDADIYMERKKNTYLSFVKDIASQRLYVQGQGRGKGSHKWVKIKSDLYGDIKSIPLEECQYLVKIL